MVSETHVIGATEQTQSHILEAAGTLFEQYGYRKTTIEEIAQEAKIGKGTVYLYFKSKEEIGMAWLATLHSHIYEELELIAKSDISPDKKIYEMLLKRIDLRFEVFTRHRRSMDEALSTLKELCRVRREDFHRREAALIADVIRDGIEKGEMIASDPDVVGGSMVLATNALLPYSMSPQQLGDYGTVMTRADNLVSLLVQAIVMRKGINS